VSVSTFKNSRFLEATAMEKDFEYRKSPLKIGDYAFKTPATLAFSEKYDLSYILGKLIVWGMNIEIVVSG